MWPGRKSYKLDFPKDDRLVADPGAGSLSCGNPSTKLDFPKDVLVASDPFTPGY